MDRRMLINAVHSEEIRIAIVEDERLVELEIESTSGRKLKGNVYKAKISRIEPSLQAAFIDIGTERNGFLQINDIHPSYFQKDPPRGRGHNKVNIKEVLSPGQEIVVQVVKEERNLKGATLTTYLSLPGRYVVLMPGSDRGGISRKISDVSQRVRLRKLSKELELPQGMGMIIRTAGLDRSLSELSRDLTNQLKLWEHIVGDAQTAASPSVLYHESDVATRVIRDYFTPDIREILIDSKETYNRVKEFVGQVMPRYRSRVKLYKEPDPIFTNFGIDEHVSDTFKSEVKLPSGGVIVIDSLEALVAIDVNSGKATAGGSIEETAFKTNMEAADEIARQLKLRDLGGLIVIDFIDMMDKRNKLKVEKRMKDAVKSDKARIEVGRLSRFGLLEMSRQRLRASLVSQSSLRCPTCAGTGRIKNHEVVALEALRKIQAAVIVGNVGIVKARLSPGPALFLLNNKKKDLSLLEEEHDVQIYILADGRMRPDEVQFEMESRQEMKRQTDEDTASSQDEKLIEESRKQDDDDQESDAPSSDSSNNAATRKRSSKKLKRKPRRVRSKSSTKRAPKDSKKSASKKKSSKRKSSTKNDTESGKDAKN